MQLSIQIRILKQVQANEARRQDDAAALLRALFGRGVDLDGLLLEHGAAVGQLEPLGLFEHAELARSTDTLRVSPPITATADAATPRPTTAASRLGPAPTAHPDLVTALAHITDPAQCAALIATLQERQNAADAAHDAADLARVLKGALSAGSDADVLAVLQIGRDEIPEAVKTLQRALERECERELDAEDAVRTETPLLASAQIEGGWSARGSVRSAKSFESAGSSWASESSGAAWRPPRDTLDREFMEGGIEALRRLSTGPVVVPSWTITRYEVDRDAKIGLGFFSDVYRGTWRGRPVAIKVLVESTPRHLFVREINVWRALRHRHVLPLFGASSATGDPPWFFVSPYLARGTLAEYLRRLSGMGGVDVLRMLHEIARGMEYLHSQDVLHGDLKVCVGAAV
jgi:abelson tyrosine-protein kinase 1